jgi:double-stranded uracil-DNA glycosylase
MPQPDIGSRFVATPPTRVELEAARHKTVRDVIAPGLRVLFCGINPGLYTAAIGHHFGRPGNRFWPALHAGGFTPRLYSPYEDGALLALGYGITNVVARATAGADELSARELCEGGRQLLRKLRRFRPRVLAVLGLGAYRVAFGQPKATVGPQHITLDGTAVWVLPNPSGLNAHYQAADLARCFARLRKWVTRETKRPVGGSVIVGRDRTSPSVRAGVPGRGRRDDPGWPAIASFRRDSPGR